MPSGIGEKFFIALTFFILNVEEVFYVPKHHPKGFLGSRLKGKTDKEGKPCNSKYKRSVILSKAKDLSTSTLCIQILHFVQNDILNHHSTPQHYDKFYQKTIYCSPRIG